MKTRSERLNLFEDFRKEAFIVINTENEQKKRIIKKEKWLQRNNLNYPKICLESFRNMQGKYNMF